LNKPALSARLSGEFDKLGPGLRRIIGNTGWLMVDRLIRMGMGLFVGVWVARYLGPEQFGSLNFAISFVALFGSVTSLGLEAIVMREVLHAPEDSRDILGTALALRSGAGFLCVGAAIGVVRLIQPHDRQALILVSIISLTLVFQAFDTIDVFFRRYVPSSQSGRRMEHFSCLLLFAWR